MLHNHHSQICTQRTMSDAVYQNFNKSFKREFTSTYESTIKKCLPKLSKWTIQDSMHRLIQTIRINQCIESQTGN